MQHYSFDLESYYQLRTGPLSGNNRLKDTVFAGSVWSHSGLQISRAKKAGNMLSVPAIKNTDTFCSVLMNKVNDKLSTASQFAFQCSNKGTENIIC